MAVRPAALSATAYIYGKQPAEQLSLIIFTVAIGMMMMSIDPYRAYYKRLFNGLPAGRDFVLYLIILGSWGAVVAASAAAILLTKGVAIPVACLTIGMFVGEKAADEILRFRLFERDMRRWSTYVIGRAALQLAGLVACLAIPDRGLAFRVYAVFFSLSWTIAFFGPVRSVAGIVGRHRAVFAGGKFWRQARRNFAASAALMLASFMMSAPIYFDKIITLLVDKASLPLFLIASMSFSIVGNFVDFFFVSRIRVELLRNDVPVAKMILDAWLWSCVAVGIAAGCCIMVAEKLLLGRIYDFDFAILALIATINASVALTAIPEQVVYWRDGPRGIFTVELPFLAGTALAFFLRLGHAWSLTSALCVVAAALVVRLGLYLLRSGGPRPPRVSIELSDLDGSPSTAP